MKIKSRTLFFLANFYYKYLSSLSLSLLLNSPHVLHFNTVNKICKDLGSFYGGKGLIDDTFAFGEGPSKKNFVLSRTKRIIVKRI